MAEAAVGFLGERSLARTSRRVYELTLRRLEKAVGAGFPVGELDAGSIKKFLAEAYPGRSSRRPGTATWPRSKVSARTAAGRAGW